MNGFQVVEIGALDEWREHHGGFDAARSRDGRRVVDHELTMQYIGLTANALAPGEEAGYPHLPDDSSRLPDKAMPWTD